MNENQTTYPTGAQDEEEIDLVALMVTLLHKLKPILLTAVVCAVIAGGLAGVKILRGGAVSAEDQVAYEEALAEYQQKEKDYEFAVQQYELTAKSNEDAQSSVQEALKQAQDYAEKSLLKNLDVYNVWTAQADLYIDSGYKIQPGSAYQNVDPTGALLAVYQKQLVSGDSMNAAADAVGVDVRYLKGVVTAELSQNDSGEYNGVMTLQAYAADQQTAEKILNALLGRLDLIHDKAAAAVCSHSVRVIDQSVTQGVSTELRALQQTSNEDVQNLQSQLVELQSARQALDDNLASAKSTWESAEEPALDGGAASSVAKYLLIGFLLGGVLACGVVVVKFLLDGMVYSASELNRSTGLPVLGALASDRTKKAGKLDAKLYQMEGRPDGSADADDALPDGSDHPQPRSGGEEYSGHRRSACGPVGSTGRCPAGHGTPARPERDRRREHPQGRCHRAPCGGCRCHCAGCRLHGHPHRCRAGAEREDRSAGQADPGLHRIRISKNKPLSLAFARQLP